MLSRSWLDILTPDILNVELECNFVWVIQEHHAKGMMMQDVPQRRQYSLNVEQSAMLSHHQLNQRASGVYHNAQTIQQIQVFLEALNHTQQSTPINKDNSTAIEFVKKSTHQKKSQIVGHVFIMVYVIENCNCT